MVVKRDMTALDLSQNEFESALALALEGNGLPQGLCKPAARVALLMALEDRDPTVVAMTWTAQDVIPLISMLNQSPTPRKRVTCIHPEHWKTIKTFAHITYVPESEESKLSGAGAGTSDND